MFWLLALAAAGAAALSSSGPSPGEAARLRRLRMAPSKAVPRLLKLNAAVRSAPKGASGAKQTPASASLPTVQEMLIAQQIRTTAVHFLRPDPKSGPDAISAWLSANEKNLGNHSRTWPKDVYPEFGWYHVDPGQKPTADDGPFGAITSALNQNVAWRAGYKLPDGSSVGWVIHDDGTWQYDHEMQSSVLSTIEDVANTVADAASWLTHQLSHIDWDGIANWVEAAASLVPGLGTAVSDIVATIKVVAEELSSDDALVKAIKAGYEYALASVPGGASLHETLDPIVDTVIDWAQSHEPLEKYAVQKLLDQVSDSPDVAGINPRSIVASLLAPVLHALGVKS